MSEQHQPWYHNSFIRNTLVVIIVAGVSYGAKILVSNNGDFITESNAISTSPVRLLATSIPEDITCPSDIRFCASGEARPVGCENDDGKGGWICGLDGEWHEGTSETPCVCVPNQR